MGFAIKTADHELQVLQQPQRELLKMNRTPKVFKAHSKKLEALKCKRVGKINLQELQAENTCRDPSEMQRQKQNFKLVLKVQSENNNKKL